jgi:hypothetical protein
MHYASWAIVVLVLGWLLAVSTGLCTGIFVIAGLSSSSGELSGPGLAGLALMIGGIPCLVGVAMILAARKWGKLKPPPVNPGVFE